MRKPLAYYSLAPSNRNQAPAAVCRKHEKKLAYQQRRHEVEYSFFTPCAFSHRRYGQWNYHLLQATGITVCPEMGLSIQHDPLLASLSPEHSLLHWFIQAIWFQNGWPLTSCKIIPYYLLEFSSMALCIVVAIPLLHLDLFCTVHTLSWEWETGCSCTWDARCKTQSRMDKSGGSVPGGQDAK